MSGAPPVRRYSTGFTTSAEARYPWPEDCSIQGGDDGIVFTQGSMSDALANPAKGVEAIASALGVMNPPGSYRTAFFEAFPGSPRSFLRGEGKTLSEAEDDCWRQWQQILACTTHDFDRKSYRNGEGICRHCGLFSMSAFPTTSVPCVGCGESAAGSLWGPDRHGRWYCKKCAPTIQESAKSDIHKSLDRMRARPD